MNSATIELTPERWQRVNEVFDKAVKMDVATRERFLERTCADDPDLLAYIKSLIEADGAPDQTVHNAIAEAMNVTFTTQPDKADDIAGARIGPYRVERLIGQGGMGAVYLAQRADEEFEQVVAIKLGRHKLVDPMTKARLKAERQILANLDHPNIARLLDGGTTDEGVPYIVMEYIDGVRIDTYCDVHRLSLDERLVLFQSICRAVHYAHQNLVIHRDIKPGNILVTTDGTPKLLDFGIAKLVEKDGVATPGLTHEGVSLMTPENASPEQVRGLAVTTATDTYSLGLLLHRLLTGLPAFELDDLSPSEFARVVCEQPATQPSRRLATMPMNVSHLQTVRHASLDEIAADRQRTIESLRRAMRGDLDTIVLKALRKEPERRYLSPLQLADDIERYRRAMPIRAHADSWRYRTAKFLQRHAFGVSVAVGGIVLLCGFVATLFLQNERIRAERDHAQSVSQFLEEIFSAPDPANARGLDITAKEILAEGSARIANELDEQPAIRAALMETIGRVYFNLGEYPPSIDMLEQSLELRRVTDGAGSASVASAENALAEALIRTADYPRAETLLLSSLETHRELFGDSGSPVATNRFNLAELYLANGDLDAAETQARQSIAIFASLQPRPAIALAEAKNVLARILQTRGELKETETLLREAIQLLETAEGDDHPLMAYYLQSLAVLLKSKGALDDAEATFARSIAVTRRVLGDEHDLVATTLTMLGSLQHERGDLAAAETAYREALKLDIAIRGEVHPFVGYDLTSLAGLLHDKGEYASAEEALRRALSIYDSTLDDDHQYIASALTELGAVLRSAGRHLEALGVLQRALEIRQRDYDDSNPLLASTAIEYGLVLWEVGRQDEARPLIETHGRRIAETTGRRAQRARIALELTGIQL